LALGSIECKLIESTNEILFLAYRKAAKECSQPQERCLG